MTSSFTRSQQSPQLDNPRKNLATDPKDFDSPSAPIPTPHRRLTGRQITGGYLPFHETFPPTSEPVSRSLNIIDKSLPEPESSSNQSLFQHHHNISLDQTTVPVSPIMSFSPLPPNSDAWASKHPGKKSLLPSLPLFHSAHYQSTNTGNPSSSRAGSPRRQFSNAQQQLHQYQRELVTGAVRSLSALTQGLAARPSPPRLHPLDSPGPVTPMTLEDHDVYLGVGDAGVNEDDSQGGRIGSLNHLIHDETEQMEHPGLLPKRHSPT